MTDAAPEPAARSARDWVLVASQGVLFLAVAAGSFVTLGPPVPRSLVASLVMVAAGAAGVVWSGVNLGKALTPLPTPNGAGLAAAGLYRLVRHPMYASLLLTCLGVAVGAGTITTYAVVFLLFEFFDIKSRLEERGLVATYPGYAEYAARTGKFFPGVARLRVPQSQG